MSEKMEKFIKSVYKKWKAQQPQDAHPDDEDLACFLENKLPEQEREIIKAHIINCDRCAEIVATQLALKPARSANVSAQLLDRVKDLAKSQEGKIALEIILRVKENILEILSTTGDVLVGRELVPAPVLRSREIKEFRDEVTVFKDFEDIRIELKLFIKQAGVFSLTVAAAEKATQKMMNDLRVAIVRDDLELESYVTSLGKVTFEHVLLGKYKVEISVTERKLASILLDIKV